MRDKILNEVQYILTKQLKEQSVRCYLFGSWARGEERKSSDIDIAILYDKPLLAGTLAKLREEFYESNIPYRVEIVDLNQCDLNFKENILKEAIEWNVCCKG